MAETESESVELPWYKAEIGPYLGAQGRQLLENYSGLHPDEVEPHAYRMVNRSLFLFLPFRVNNFAEAPEMMITRSLPLT